MPFIEPNKDKLKETIHDETARRGNIDWSEKKWKPKPGRNVIRVLPAKTKGMDFHLRYARHFVRHNDRTESFVCNYATYGKPCPACEEGRRLYKSGEKDLSRKYWSSKFGMFNILDRTEKDQVVKLYEAPHSVWWAIITFADKEGIFDKFDKDGKITTPGRDIVINFAPRNAPAMKYQVYPGDTTVLGDKGQIEKWIGELVDLDLEKLVPEVDYDIAKIKTFGDQEEREALREMLKTARQGNQTQSESQEKELTDEDKGETEEADEEETKDIEEKTTEFSPDEVETEEEEVVQKEEPVKGEPKPETPEKKPEKKSPPKDTKSRLEAIKEKLAKRTGK